MHVSIPLYASGGICFYGACVASESVAARTRCGCASYGMADIGRDRTCLYLLATAVLRLTALTRAAAKSMVAQVLDLALLHKHGLRINSKVVFPKIDKLQGYLWFF